MYLPNFKGKLDAVLPQLEPWVPSLPVQVGDALQERLVGLFDPFFLFILSRAGLWPWGIPETRWLDEDWGD